MWRAALRQAPKSRLLGGRDARMGDTQGSVRLSVPVLLDTERRITDAGLSQIGSGLLPKGTVLLSSRAPIGYLAIAEIPVAINQGFIAMTPKTGASNIFLLLWASIRTRRDSQPGERFDLPRDQQSKLPADPGRHPIGRHDASV